jgi:polysaccharide export outer membrane protein
MNISFVGSCFRAIAARARFDRRLVVAVLCAATSLLFSSCASQPVTLGPPTKVVPDVQTLSPGDVIKIAFPGAPNLDTSQQIRRDGRVNLSIIGEVKVADKTPSQLEKDLLEAYSSQLVSKEVKVTVVSSTFSVYVSGAVMKPGKVLSERALTAFDAIMEAGGLDPTRANAKKVRVIRQEDGQIKNYPIDVDALLKGEGSEPFYLKAHDTVHVPEKISWF